MPLWSLTKKPAFDSEAYATEEGWAHPETNEILVSISHLQTRQAEVRDAALVNLLGENGDLLILESLPYTDSQYLLLED